MANPFEITVITVENSHGWTFTVQVRQQNGETRHSVRLKREDHKRLINGTQAGPEELVKKSFEFWLEREPKESILRQFDLPLMAKHFPDYSAEIHKRLK